MEQARKTRKEMAGRLKGVGNVFDMWSVSSRFVPLFDSISTQRIFAGRHHLNESDLSDPEPFAFPRVWRKHALPQDLTRNVMKVLS